MTVALATDLVFVRIGFTTLAALSRHSVLPWKTQSAALAPHAAKEREALAIVPSAAVRACKTTEVPIESRRDGRTTADAPLTS